MNQKIFSSAVLIIIGVLVGLFILTSYQFHRRVKNLEAFVINNDSKITVIENFINTNLVRKPNEGGS
ncbi:MAG: hypothetical protein ABIG10_01205 [bacterium]